MRLAPFLIARRPVHPEHAEHYATNRTVVRLEPRQMAQITIVVRCGRVRRIRLRIAMSLMWLAGRLGGFKAVKMIRDR